MVEKLETHLWASTGYSPHDRLTHLRIEEPNAPAEEGPFSHRHFAGLWFFEPWTFLKYLPQNRRSKLRANTAAIMV